MMCQCQLISCDKRSTGEGCWQWGTLCTCRDGAYRKSPCLLHSFAVNLKLKQKPKSILKCITGKQGESQESVFAKNPVDRAVTVLGAFRDIISFNLIPLTKGWVLLSPLIKDMKERLCRDSERLCDSIIFFLVSGLEIRFVWLQHTYLIHYKEYLDIKAHVTECTYNNLL